MEYQFPPVHVYSGGRERRLLAGRADGPLSTGMPASRRRTTVGEIQRGPRDALARGPDGSLWVGILAAGPGRGLEQLKDGAFKPFVTPTLRRQQAPVHQHLMFDRDGNLWVGPYGNGLFRIHGNMVDHLRPTEWPVRRFSCMLFLKTGKELSGLRLPAESTAFAIRQLPPSRA